MLSQLLQCDQGMLPNWFYETSLVTLAYLFSQKIYLPA